MGFLAVFFIALALSLDSLVVCLTLGIGLKHGNGLRMIRVAAFMGSFHFIMPLIGWLIGSSLSKYIEAFDHWIAFVLLSIIGLKMILEGFRNRKEKSCFCSSKLSVLLTVAFATSIDALVIGLGFAFIQISITSTVFIIGIVNFFVSLLGVFLGYKLKKKSHFSLEIPGGLVLIFIGVKILYEHLIV